MRYTSFLPGILVTVLGLTAGAPRASADELPFRLQGAGQLSVGPNGAGTFTAAGQATYLGQWTNEGTIQFVPGEAPGTLEAEGTVTFTGANGDTIYMTFEGVLDLTTGIGLAAFHIDGGTGRFAGADGETDAVIYQNPDGSFTFRLDGTIDY